MSESNKSASWFAKHKALSIVGVIIILIIVIVPVSTSGNSDTKTTDVAKHSDTSSQPKQKPQPEQKSKPAKRVVKGEATTIGAGTFTGGKDVAAGLYDITPGAGQSGNFIVNQGESYNEVLGGDSFGVSKVRANIAKGDKIKISGLSRVSFKPVTAKYVTKHAKATLYAGTFAVGQDVGAGRYVVSPGSGESGNFIVNDGASYNEVLGHGDFGVPKLTVSLSDGDKITISGLSTVNFKPID